MSTSSPIHNTDSFDAHEREHRLMNSTRGALVVGNPTQAQEVRALLEGLSFPYQTVFCSEVGVPQLQIQDDEYVGIREIREFLATL